MDWDEAVWHVYNSPRTGTRVEAPRTHHVVKKDGKGNVLSREKYPRPLNKQELRPGESLVMTVTGLSRRTVLHLIRQHGIDGLKNAVQDLDVRHKSAAVARNAKLAAIETEFRKKPDIGNQPRHPDQDKPSGGTIPEPLKILGVKVA